MKRIFSIASMLTFLGMTTISYAYIESGVIVGKIRVEKSNGGFYTFGRSGGAIIRSGLCAGDPIQWWTGGYTTATEAGSKAILSVLLTAKTTGLPISVEFDEFAGYCRVNSVWLE